MKITKIAPVLADGGHRVFVFVKIETDQPGLIGWGEASLEGKPRECRPLAGVEGGWRRPASPIFAPQLSHGLPSLDQLP